MHCLFIDSITELVIHYCGHLSFVTFIFHVYLTWYFIYLIISLYYYSFTFPGVLLTDPDIDLGTSLYFYTILQFHLISYPLYIYILSIYYTFILCTYYISLIQFLYSFISCLYLRAGVSLNGLICFINYMY